MQSSLQEPIRQDPPINRFEYQLALIDPALIFDAPRDVVNSESLTRAQKIQILRLWEYDGRELDVAAEEGMESNGPNLLAAVHAALKTMNETLDLDHEPPTKHGGAGANQ